jgi:DcuC family C4-dicarboxylate transporter
MSTALNLNKNHILRLVVIFFAVVYLFNYFLNIQLLNYIGAALLLFIMSQAIFRLPKVNRRVVLGLFALGAVLLLFSGATPIDWLKSLTKNANLVTLFICVPMMSMPFFYEDYQSELKVVAQTRMQSLLPFCALVALSTHILGVLISVGAIAIIYELMLPNAKLYKSEDIFLATMTRSYSSSGFWSPAWASIVVVTTQLKVDWLSLIPVGVVLAIIFNLLDLATVLIKVKRHPEEHPRLQAEENTQVNWSKIRTMLLLAAVLIAMIIVISVITSWDLMIIIPIVSIIFPILCALVQGHKAEYVTGMKKYYDKSLIKVQSEVTLFTAAGFLGKALDISGVGQLLPHLLPQWLYQYPAILLAAIMLMIILPSLVGVHPVATGTAMVAAIVPASIGLSTPTFALTIIMGWLLGILLSPFSATSLMCSGFTGKTSWAISLGLNGKFGFACVIIFSILISIIGPLMSF